MSFSVPQLKTMGCQWDRICKTLKNSGALQTPWIAEEQAAPPEMLIRQGGEF